MSYDSIRDGRSGKINAAAVNPYLDLYETVPGYPWLHISVNKNIYSDLPGYDRYLKIYWDKKNNREYINLPIRCHGYTKYEKVSLDRLYRSTFYIPRNFDTRSVLRRTFENGWALSKVVEI